MTGDEDELVGELSEPVRAALDEAVRLVESLLEDLTRTDEEDRMKASHQRRAAGRDRRCWRRSPSASRCSCPRSSGTSKIRSM